MPTVFNNSFEIDRRFFKAEIRSGLAHAEGLFRAGILTRMETERVKNGLWTMLKRAEIDRHYFDALPSTDVFSFVEARLYQLINESAAKLKIGRTREHRVAVVLRLWLRDEIWQILEIFDQLFEALEKTNDELSGVFFEVFERDNERFDEILHRVNRMPLGRLNLAEDEALAEIDFAEIGRELGFETTSHNVLDSITDRDFCLEFVGASSFVMLHLARFASEILNHFPQQPLEIKHALELLRGKSSKIIGSNAALFSLLKSAPLAPTEDLQEINEIVFDASDTLQSCLRVTLSILPQIVFSPFPAR